MYPRAPLTHLLSEGCFKHQPEMLLSPLASLHHKTTLLSTQTPNLSSSTRHWQETPTHLMPGLAALSRAGQVPQAHHGSHSNLLGCSGFCSTPSKPQRHHMAPGDVPLQDLVCSTGVMPGRGSRAVPPTPFHSAQG